VTVAGDADTIVAIATPVGRGGVGVIRLSGPRARELLQNMTQCVPEPRQARFARFHDRAGAIVDHGLALYFPAPRSFTGEDVAELQAHGSPVALGLLVTDLVERGARLARPGEFSERAFLNGKLDLTQAEAVADLINAASEQAARAATRSMEGHFAEQIGTLRHALVQLQVQVEAHLDFAEDLPDGSMDLRASLDDLLSRTAALLKTAVRAHRIQDGLQIAIIGRPNTGKSSLLNCLLGSDSAIVSDQPGTTRDTISQPAVLGGIAVQLLDTAGLRSTTEAVEVEGINRAWRAAGSADLVFVVIDSTDFDPAQDLAPLTRLPAATTVALIFNKIDLSDQTPRMEMSRRPAEMRLSVKTGRGMEHIDDFLRWHIGTQAPAEVLFSARQRHVEALANVQAGLRDLHAQLSADPPGEELVAEYLRRAQQTLGEITGVFSNEDLLGAIFQSFCIGK
jgi:tRNA modification GTPase